MRKINEKLKSVRMKLFLTLSTTVILIILLLIILNSIVLEAFYTFSKIKAVKGEYRVINELYNNSSPSILSKIKNDAITNNFDILIENEDYMLVFSTNENFTNSLNRNKDIKTYFKDYEREKETTLYVDENIAVKRILANGLNCILLSGTLDNGYKIYIQIPVAAIEESVRISNKLLVIIGFIIIVVAGIIASYISKKFTNPILELNDITNKMSKLDFSQKYELTDMDDEIDELGRNINTMSERLEGTIKQLRNSNIELERDIEEKSKIDEMRKQFISDVSHELKTPIALIQGYSEGLLENVNADEESRRYYAEVILDESNRMDKLVKQLLELMKLEYGRRDFNNREFDICEMIREVIRRCNVMLKEFKIDDVRFTNNEHITVYGDPFYIDQAFTNYFTNAIKHVKKVNEESYIEITVKELPEKNKVRISVFNTGETLSEEDLDRIWGRFYKVDESRNRSDGGSGIGLSLVKAIMNNYGSKYGAENKENGIEFYFEIQKSS